MTLRRIHASSPGAAEALAALCDRGATLDPEVERRVADIVREVRARGDAAVAELTRRFDGREPTGGTYEIGPERRSAALAGLGPRLRRALERATERVRRFHSEQGRRGYDLDGGKLALRSVPLRRVGLYVPGGTALYPSSVLMTAIPAALAGVDEIVMVTPGASDVTLAAAELAGVHRVFEIGGAQAIAALAFGTATVPRVDKIVGPGNQWVAAAKRQVYGAVDIDSIAGPSEVLIIADDSARADHVAADLLAQAEHDREARSILVTPSLPLADAVDAALAEQIPRLARHEIARESIERHGTCVLVASVDAAVDIAERYAPEHLELATDDAAALVPRIRAAGAIFVGHHSPEAAGDYLAGPNHVLPTSGAARYASPLGVYDFQKFVSVIAWSAADLAAEGDDIEALAEVEGLTAHARSVSIRREDSE